MKSQGSNRQRARESAGNSSARCGICRDRGILAGNLENTRHAPVVAEPFAINQVRDDSSPAHPAVTICREDGAVVVHIPVHFRRRNGRQMILTCDGQQHPARQDRTVNSALVSALAKAYHWQEQLESGQYVRLEQLATAHGVDRSYVGRILRLTSLSPEIVELILDGKEPNGLSLRKLLQGFSLDWQQQRKDWLEPKAE